MDDEVPDVLVRVLTSDYNGCNDPESVAMLLVSDSKNLAREVLSLWEILVALGQVEYQKDIDVVKNKLKQFGFHRLEEG